MVQDKKSEQSHKNGLKRLHIEISSQSEEPTHSEKK